MNAGAAPNKKPFFKVGDTVRAACNISRQDQRAHLREGGTAVVKSVSEGTDCQIIDIEASEDRFFRDLVCFDDQHPLSLVK